MTSVSPMAESPCWRRQPPWTLIPWRHQDPILDPNDNIAFARWAPACADDQLPSIYRTQPSGQQAAVEIHARRFLPESTTDSDAF